MFDCFIKSFLSLSLSLFLSLFCSVLLAFRMPIYHLFLALTCGSTFATFRFDRFSKHFISLTAVKTNDFYRFMNHNKAAQIYPREVSTLNLDLPAFWHMPWLTPSSFLKSPKSRSPAPSPIAMWAGSGLHLSPGGVLSKINENMCQTYANA